MHLRLPTSRLFLCFSCSRLSLLHAHSLSLPQRLFASAAATTVFCTTGDVCACVHRKRQSSLSLSIHPSVVDLASVQPLALSRTNTQTNTSTFPFSNEKSDSRRLIAWLLGPMHKHRCSLAAKRRTKRTMCTMCISAGDVGILPCSSWGYFESVHSLQMMHTRLPIVQRLSGMCHGVHMAQLKRQPSPGSPLVQRGGTSRRDQRDTLGTRVTFASKQEGKEGRKSICLRTRHNGNRILY